MSKLKSSHHVQSERIGSTSAIETSANTSAPAAANVEGPARNRVESPSEMPNKNQATSAARMLFGPGVDAQKAITDKAASLGAAFTGARTSALQIVDSVGVEGGYQQSFENCTIYFSPLTGAHEVHGDILRKYQIIPGKGFNYGLPVTDETGAPDGLGRYNHFANGASIYWHPHTGPMAVHGAVRDHWAAQGWERGQLGYPVRDVFSPDAGELAGDFQNGVVWVGPGGYEDAQIATLAPDKVLTAVWSQFDAVVRADPNNVGLQPEKSLDSVSDTSYGLAQSGNRQIVVTIHGFHDNGLLPDTNFAATITVLLQADPDGLVPGGHVIHATVTASSVHAAGLGPATLTSRMITAIQTASDAGITIGASIPPTVPLLSFKIGLDGSVNIFLSPTLAGKFAKVVLQKSLDNL